MNYIKRKSSQPLPTGTPLSLEIDILSGDFEVDADEDAVHDRLFARRPKGHFVLMRADGSPAGMFGFAF